MSVWRRSAVSRPVSVLVLAGRRPGATDPLAARFGVADKCLVPLAGKPLLEHVLETLAVTPQVGRIMISLNEPRVLDALPVAKQLVHADRARAMKASGNLADSVIAACRQLKFPILITTADNVLLTPAAIETMAAQCGAASVDAAAAFARKPSILAAHPEGQRRFYRFSDDSYSNCNCYWIANERALDAAEIFRSGGQFSKNPLRIAATFGLWNLVRFRLGWLSLAGMFATISRRFGLSMKPVIFDDGALAIDVDNERTYQVVSEILASRSPASDAAAAANQSTMETATLR